MSNRAFDKSNRGVRQSQMLPVAYGWRTAGQASDGPVDAWVDDMEGDWDDREEIIVKGAWHSDTEVDADRDPLVQRLAPIPLAPVRAEALVAADGLVTDLAPAEPRVMERSTPDQ
jgi:hypothetical protein